MFRPGNEVELEDGSLDAGALVWASDRQGALGTGRHMALATLQPGAHTLTLTATDSDAMTGTASVTICVGYPVWLPLVQK